METVTKNVPINETVLECLSVLSDRQRSRIVVQLTKGEHCSCELSELLGIRQNTLSHHLKALRDQEIILARKKPSDQRWIYYRLNPEKLHLLSDVLSDWAALAEDVEPRNVICPIE